MRYVRNLRSYGKSGWLWEENHDGEWYEYSTNEQGEGLFTRCFSNSRRQAPAGYCGNQATEWHQLLGTCQYQLNPNRSAAYNKILRDMKKEM